MAPFGPIWWGVPWLTFLFVGVIVAFILAALTPDRRRIQDSAEARRQAKAQAESLIAIDAFFWILIVGLMLAILFGYLN